MFDDKRNFWNIRRLRQSFVWFETVDEENKLNATYTISVARKLGCSFFLLPEDIIEVRTVY